MSLIEDALYIAARNSNPDWIEWAWSQPQADKNTKIACLNNTHCPEHVREQGYQSPVALRKVALTYAPVITDAWRQAVANETSVQILRELIDNGDTHADEILADRDDDAITRLIKEAIAGVPGFYAHKMPRLYWKHSSAQEWKQLGREHLLARLYEPDCTGEQLGQLLTFILDKMMRDRPETWTEEEIDVIGRRLADDREHLVEAGIDIRALNSTFQAVHHTFLNTGERARDTKQDDIVGQILAKYPWLPTYPWPEGEHFPHLGLKVYNGWQVADLCYALVDQGDYITAGNIMVQVTSVRTDEVSRGLRGSERKIVALTREWLTWALDNDVSNEHLAHFTKSMSLHPGAAPIIRQINDPRLYEAINTRYNSLTAWTIYGLDACLDLVLDCSDGRVAMTQALVGEDPTVADAADSLADSWKGSFNELLTAARLSVS